MNEYIVAVNGLEALDDIESLEPRLVRAAQQAINRTARDRRASGAREITEQVAFPARYLSPSQGRLSVSAFASPRNLEAEITGRDRPTSLARYASNRNPKASRQAGGVTVTVKPGNPVFMKGAFIMQLRNNNLGLALRLSKGDALRNRKYAKQVASGLYLLYGPSVNQVWRGVAEDGVNETADALEREFLRLLEL